MKFAILFAMLFIVATGCTKEVPPGTIGRINTPNGWQPEILKPGYHTVTGRDKLYLLDVTFKTFPEQMNILIGGKVNLRVNYSVRVRANVANTEQIKNVFESVSADKNQKISVDKLYKTFLKMKAQAIPRRIFEIQPTIQAAMTNSPSLAEEMRKKIQEVAKTTPLTADDAQITNYDWPTSITRAQEELVKVQLKEASEKAQVRADLQRARGQLLVEEANKLVEMKKAQAMAESINIIKNKLGGASGYLLWHQIRMLSDAAKGPNNAFILYPYGTDASQIKRMIGNANLTQILNPSGKQLLKGKNWATVQNTIAPPAKNKPQLAPQPTRTATLAKK